MNRLIVPERTLIGELKDAFNYRKRAMMSGWLWACLLLGVYVTLLIIVMLTIILGELNGSIIGCSVLAGIMYFIMKVIGTRHIRSKIIADMKSSILLSGAYSPDGHRQGEEYVGILPTMAGKLRFISIQLPSLGIEKKVGEYYSYFVYKDVENLGKKDLRKFIVFCSNPEYLKPKTL